MSGFTSARPAAGFSRRRILRLVRVSSRRLLPWYRLLCVLVTSQWAWVVVATPLCQLDTWGCSCWGCLEPLLL
jgi:hypothetical protein